MKSNAGQPRPQPRNATFDAVVTATAANRPASQTTASRVERSRQPNHSATIKAAGNMICASPRRVTSFQKAIDSISDMGEC